MSNAYFLHKIKHELCFVNKINYLQNQIYAIDMPVIVPVNKLNATDGRLLMQRIIFQQLNSNSAKQIGFLRGLITLSSEPDHFQTHLMLNCTTDQISEPAESEWVAAIENGLDTGNDLLPFATMSSDVKLNAWGIKDYIYDLKLEFYPNNEITNAFTCECSIKYINPDQDPNLNVLDFENGFNFLIFSKKSNSFIPFLIPTEERPYFFLNDAEILEHELTINEDKIGHELYVKCLVKK